MNICLIIIKMLIISVHSLWAKYYIFLTFNLYNSSFISMKLRLRLMVKHWNSSKVEQKYSIMHFNDLYTIESVEEHIIYIRKIGSVPIKLRYSFTWSTTPCCLHHRGHFKGGLQIVKSKFQIKPNHAYILFLWIK